MWKPKGNFWELVVYVGPGDWHLRETYKVEHPRRAGTRPGEAAAGEIQVNAVLKEWEVGVAGEDETLERSPGT